MCRYLEIKGKGREDFFLKHTILRLKMTLSNLTLQKMIEEPRTTRTSTHDRQRAAKKGQNLCS
jgi:hypothetical protein